MKRKTDRQREMKRKPKIISHTPTVKDLDDLWSKCVKVRAGNRSEISGKEGPLNSHHILGKPNHRLRWELRNGIALTSGEHRFGIHNEGRKEEYWKRIVRVRGQDTIDMLRLLVHVCGNVDRNAVKLYLEQELKKAKMELNPKEAV